MGALSKTALVAFEILNELYTAVGAGVLGMAVLLQHAVSSHNTIKCLMVVGITGASLVYAFSREKEQLTASKKRVVLITGCDSGLGFSLAQHAAECGFTVIATFLSLDSKGAKEIKRLFGGYIIQIQLDISDSTSIKNSLQTLQHYFSKNPDYCLHALVNNAGIMVFGEFEWQTEILIKRQIEVNLMGSMNFTNAFCPLLRQHKGRVVTISSHCSIVNLPGLTVYGATKAALSSWMEGMRREMSKYGVQVVTFIPGSFTTESNIMSRQLQNVQEMHDHFTEEQHRFYSDYFKRYNIYLSFIKPPPEPQKIQDEKLYKIFERVLLDKQPDFIYKHEPLRYSLYHLLFKLSSPWEGLQDYFVNKFMQMPEYKEQEAEENEDNFSCDCD